MTVVSLEPFIADTFTQVTKPVTRATRVNTGHDSAVGAGKTLLALTLAVNALAPVVTGGVLTGVGRDVTFGPFPALVAHTYTLAVLPLTITKVWAFTF